MASLTRAILIAAEAHDGQLDGAGEPYILHPLRMVTRLAFDDQRQVAALHDVVERTDWTLDRLAAEGFDPRILAAVHALTRREGEAYDDFVRRAIANPLARPVKRADLLDNLATARRGPPSPRTRERIERYERALRVLDDLPVQPSGSLSLDPGSMLLMPAGLAGRLLALRQLTRGRSAFDRLGPDLDADALHDFRVALRRLRSLCRACHPYLEGVVRREDRKRLRRIARATSARRDADVHLDIVTKAIGDGKDVPALDALVQRLQAGRARAGNRIRRRAMEDFPPLERRLRRRLTRYELDPAGREGTGTVPLGRILETTVEQLSAALVADLSDAVLLSADRLHAARIAGKRLRYALEPLLPLEPARRAVTTLTELQDLIGGMRDLDGLLDLVATAGAESDPDLGALCERLREDRAAAEERLRAEWIGVARVGEKLGPVEQVVAVLRAGIAPAA